MFLLPAHACVLESGAHVHGAYKFNLQRDRLLRQVRLGSGQSMRWSLAIGVSSQLDRKVFLERYSHTFLGAVYK